MRVLPITIAVACTLSGVASAQSAPDLTGGTGTIYVSGFPNRSFIIDEATETVVDEITMTLDGPPSALILSEDGTRFYLRDRTYEQIEVIDVAARFADLVLVETAGAGQADTALRKSVDTFVTLADPRGDAITLLKAGHHRHARILVANARTGSEDEERFFSLARSFVETLPPSDGWKVPFFRVGALSGDGVPELVRQGLFAHRKSLGR